MPWDEFVSGFRVVTSDNARCRGDVLGCAGNPPGGSHSRNNSIDRAAGPTLRESDPSKKVASFPR